MSKTLPYDSETNTVLVDGTTIEITPVILDIAWQEVRRFSDSYWNYLTDVKDAAAWPSVPSYVERFKDGKEQF